MRTAILVRREGSRLEVPLRGLGDREPPPTLRYVVWHRTDVTLFADPPQRAETSRTTELYRRVDDALDGTPVYRFCGKVATR